MTSMANRSRAARKAARSRKRMKETRAMDKDHELLAALIEQGVSYVHDILLVKKDKSLMPIWHLQSPEGAMVIGTPWKGDEEKTAMTAYVREQIKKSNATAYSFISEAWVSAYTSEEIQGRDLEAEGPAERPAKRANRVEAVVIFASTRSGQRMTNLRIVRDANEEIVDLPPFDPAEGKQGAEKFGGVFPSMLD